VLLAYQSMNGTNNLKTHLNFCTAVRSEKENLHQTTVLNFYSSKKKRFQRMSRQLFYNHVLNL